MFKIEQKDNIYEVKVKLTNKLIGHFIHGGDGFYYFTPYDYIDGGFWSDYSLIEIGNKLKEINGPYLDSLKEIL
jgi:hypothetical protein